MSATGKKSPRRAGDEALAWAVAAGAAPEVLAAVRARRRRRVRFFAAGGAGVLAAALALALWPRPRALPSAPAVAATTSPTLIVEAPGREVLPDGTVVLLRPGARIAMDYSDGLRRVALTAGEAHFAVVRDPRRPFVVAAGGVEVRAVGTAFAVRHDAAEIGVLVTEGRVAVGRAAQTASLVDAGQQVNLPLATAGNPEPAPIHSVSEAERDRLLAWRVPHLRFSGALLAEVVAALNRHAAPGAPRLAAEPAIAALQISGTLRADDPESLVLLLATEFGIRAVPDAGGTLLLRR